MFGNLEIEQILGFVALVWLLGSLLLMTRSIKRGRELADTLAVRHRDIYEQLGRPRPGYFESVRRTRFARFVGRREFEQLADGRLSAQFAAYRKAEARVIVFILASGAVLALLGAVLHRMT